MIYRMNQVGAGWVMGASLLALVACGGGSEKPSSAAAGAASDSPQAAGGDVDGSAGSSIGGSPGSAGTATHAGAGGKSAGAGTGGQAEGATYNGDVQVGWYDGGQAFHTTASADFYSPSAGTGTQCTSEMFGQCFVTTCAAGAAVATHPQAGVITVSNGMKFNATLTPNSDGSYPVHTDPNILLPGDDNITISATGGDVPAFSAMMIQPLTLLITSPVADSSGQVAWPRDTDLELNFERGLPNLELLLQGGASPGVFLSCSFPSETGTAFIPTAALKAMPAGTILSLFTYNAEEITAGEYTITLRDFSAAMDPNKKRGIRLTLQ